MKNKKNNQSETIPKSRYIENHNQRGQDVGRLIPLPMRNNHSLNPRANNHTQEQNKRTSLSDKNRSGEVESHNRQLIPKAKMSAPANHSSKECEETASRARYQKSGVEGSNPSPANTPEVSGKEAELKPTADSSDKEPESASTKSLESENLSDSGSDIFTKQIEELEKEIENPNYEKDRFMKEQEISCVGKGKYRGYNCDGLRIVMTKNKLHKEFVKWCDKYFWNLRTKLEAYQEAQKIFRDFIKKLERRAFYIKFNGENKEVVLVDEIHEEAGDLE